MMTAKFSKSATFRSAPRMPRCSKIPAGYKKFDMNAMMQQMMQQGQQ